MNINQKWFIIDGITFLILIPVYIYLIISANYLITKILIALILIFIILFKIHSLYMLLQLCDDFINEIKKIIK
jgi:hypothetical protein